METTTKKCFEITLVPENDIPDDGWDAAIRKVVIYAKGDNMKDAEELAVQSLQMRSLYMKFDHGKEITSEEISIHQ